MGCNCKNKSSVEDNTVAKFDFVNLLIKLSAFTIALLLLPVIMVVIVWFIFNTLVLNKETDFKPLLQKLGEKFSDKEDDDDDDDIEVFTEDDVIAINVEDITKK